MMYSRHSAARCAAVAVLASLLVAPRTVEAQVGHTPLSSPYQDVKFGQTLTAFGGWLNIKRDPAGVSPEPAAFGQLRYDIAVGGPALMFARYTMAPTQRNVLVPAVPVAQRILRTQSTTMHVMDAGIDLALTGRKSWHRLVPSLSGSAGLVSDFAEADSGAYKFGTKFTLSYGVGLRHVRTNGVQFRVDATNFLWQYDYPDRYFVTASDSSAILGSSKGRSAWRGNWALAAGVAFPLFR